MCYVRRPWCGSKAARCPLLAHPPVISKQRLWIVCEAVWLDSDITVWSKPTANQRLCAIKQQDGGAEVLHSAVWYRLIPLTSHQWKWRNRVVSCFDPVLNRDGAVVWAQAGSAFYPYCPVGDLSRSNMFSCVRLGWAERAATIWSGLRYQTVVSVCRRDLILG